MLPGTNLKEIYIRRNSISDLSEVAFLAKLQGLRVLWMSENPVSSVPGYRDYVIKALPQLARLDNEGECAGWDDALTGVDTCTGCLLASPMLPDSAKYTCVLSWCVCMCMCVHPDVTEVEHERVKSLSLEDILAQAGRNATTDASQEQPSSQQTTTSEPHPTKVRTCVTRLQTGVNV